MDFRERYQREPMLHNLVETMVGVLERQEMTAPDLARAAVLATQLYAEQYGARVVVSIGDDGLPKLTAVIPGLHDEPREDGGR